VPHTLSRLLAAIASASLVACSGDYQEPGTPTGPGVPASAIESREAGFLKDSAEKQILFGDLHVHTTYSADAFTISLPMMGGQGLHPPADACDYARHCAAIDFWSINDHAEGSTPAYWESTREAIRQCNALAGDPAAPDTVAFLGWEWSQVGPTPATHFGHKNVVLRDTEEGSVPTRPIAAPRPEFRVPPLPAMAKLLLPLVYFSERQRYFDYFRYQDEVAATEMCPQGVPVRDLPDDCHEIAHDATELFEKLDDWGREYLVIPHGTTWGLMTPPRSSWEHQLTEGLQPVAGRQTLFEVHSGHGSSELHRDFAAVAYDAEGMAYCPEPTPEYTPCCWRAGEIIRERCQDPASQACDALVVKARADHAASGVTAHNSIPGVSVEDWLDCGQCRDCDTPAFNYRPNMSAQYALATGEFRFGLVASSDTHGGHGGNGYKEKGRKQLSEARGPVGRIAKLTRPQEEPLAESRVVNPDAVPLMARRYTERGNSMLLSGGLAAVHAAGRDRDAIWDAMDRKEVYGTTGDRILLWFDLENAPGGSAPMGAEVKGQDRPPRFRVRAVGSFEQKPGCPDFTQEALGDAGVESLCLGECYHPSDRRRLITRIEVVRILPRRSDDEPMNGLIQDPWRSFQCAPDPSGCAVRFEDPLFLAGSREAAYYVRAVQEPTLAINGQGFRCRYDETGRCIEVDPCYGDDRTPMDDDCLGETEERAWSSPIFVQPETSRSGL
jgi:hypothetical protein